MLRQFHIQNFKSLLDFTLDDMGQFVCLVGLNDSGKTTVLQALDFIAHLASGNLPNWFLEHGWKPADIRGKSANKRHIPFKLRFSLPAGEVEWQGLYSHTHSRCLEEEVLVNGKSVMKLAGEQAVTPYWQVDIKRYSYSGSTLSTLSDSPEQGLNQLRKSLQSLSLINFPSSHSTNSHSKLARAIHALPPQQKLQLQEDMKKFFPRLTAIHTKAKRGGAAQLNLEFHEKDGKLEINSLHLGNGLLRILALITELQTEPRILLVDEIENAISPELAATFIPYLLESNSQLIFTTHSPVILNQLAREAIYLLSRNPNSLKLNVSSPREVLSKTFLTQLSK